MIFLSKNGEDQYINWLAQSWNCEPVADFDYQDSTDPIWLRGILKHKIIKRCWDDKRTFYFVDTGYFGNNKEWKVWHRITKNNLVQTQVLDVPDDRWKKFGIQFKPWQKGRHVVLAAPDQKPCKFYNIELEQWITQTVAELKRYTDRPILIRRRDPLRINRIKKDTLAHALQGAHALVTFNSNAAVESILQGIPAFTLAPNAAAPVASQDLSRIESPWYPDQDQLLAWACSLSYSQFHNDELKNGTAIRMLLDL